MKDQARATVAVTREEADRQGRLRPRQGRRRPARRPSRATPPARRRHKADAYLDKYAAASARAPDELVRTGVAKTDGSAGPSPTPRPTRASTSSAPCCKANVDRDGDLTAVNGYAAPGLVAVRRPAPSARPRPASSAVAPGPRATRHDPRRREGRPHRHRAEEHRARRLPHGRDPRARPATAVLAYQVEVTNDDEHPRHGVHRRQHRQAGQPLLDGQRRPRPRALRDQPRDPPTRSGRRATRSPAPSTRTSRTWSTPPGEAYWLLENTFGRDSYDGAGAMMRTVNNDPRISCPNANWNGITTNYCDGVTSDDVVSHEWGHAYTEYTSGLIYQYQSGALNESYSDVWGETLDLINGREDEGEGDIAAKRAVGDCDPTAPPGPRHDDQLPRPAVAGPCLAVAASGAAASPPPPVTADVVVGHSTPPTPPARPPPTAARAFTNAARRRRQVGLRRPRHLHLRRQGRPTPWPPAPPASSSATTTSTRRPGFAGRPRASTA